MRNLIVISNNDTWMVRFLCSFSSNFDKKMDKQDFLISDIHKDFLSDKKCINKETIKNDKLWNIKIQKQLLDMN